MWKKKTPKWPSVFRQLRPDSTSTTHSSSSLFKLTSMVWSGNVQPQSLIYLCIYFVSVVWICFLFFLIYIVFWNTACVLLLQCDCSVLPFSVYCLSPVSLFQPYCHSEVTSCGETRAHALQWNVSPSIICFLNHLFVNRMCTPNKAQDTES